MDKKKIQWTTSPKLNAEQMEQKAKEEKNRAIREYKEGTEKGKKASFMLDDAIFPMEQKSLVEVLIIAFGSGTQRVASR